MSVYRKFLGTLCSFAGNRRGNVAMIYALSLLPLAVASGAGLDFARAMIVRTSLAEALDAAGLAVGSSPQMSQADMQTLAQSYFDANYKQDPSYGTPSAVSVVQNGQDFTLSANITMPTVLMRIAGVDSLPVSSTVTITRNSKNLEVALALDTTGSMSGTRIADLKTAAADLIDLVVQDAQSPTYSKVALIPYSMAVNAGSYADQVRGAILPGKVITGATKNNPIVITAANHGFVNGDYVVINAVAGMTQLNGNIYKVGNVSTDKFSLYNQSTGASVNGTSGYSTYTSGGFVYCTNPGCQYYRFTNASTPTAGVKTLPVSTCATERTTNAYTDASPSTTYLGRNYHAISPYASSANPCIDATIIPLSSDKASLKTAVSNLKAEGSTSGHIGIAWAWYTLAQNFGYLWPGTSAAAAYNADNTMKFAVLMTDGAFNTPYYMGVISRDAGSGSGSSSDHINQNASNGSSAYQASRLCSAMKEKGIIVYTVGFAIGGDTDAVNLLTNCATDPSHAYFPATGSDLKKDFHDIAQQITNLRIKN